MPPTAGSSTASFLFDLASPECWLVAERILQVMPVATEWVPVKVDDPLPAFRCAEERDIWLVGLARRASDLGLQAPRWPEPLDFDSLFAMRAATFAKGTGRAVAFSQAAFRQAWCGARPLDDPDNVLIAAAACELHPKAVLKGAALRSTGEALAAASAGVQRVPAIVTPTGERFEGEDAPERAAATLAAA